MLEMVLPHVTRWCVHMLKGGASTCYNVVRPHVIKRFVHML